ncbi:MULTISPECIES: type II CAAX endopeptidase family protein [Paenibacillus]|uniref:CAAX prenyl protease 2/Lysostaphin resistance protein A-like domain-containing protein n=1 Tax=Paenibacillus lautus TaxID=1401 RepID=A0A1R1A4W8_PAELA|nr:type II CAAX endopeptidase family protein [Paenibacillus lautus]OME80590.1 hypothetical protein BK123_34360 [Paenibacillus lautus]
MNKKLTIQYIVGSLLITWLLWGAIIVVQQFGYLKYGTPLFMVLFILGTCTPPIVAVTLLLKYEIIPAKKLLKTIFSVKQPILMYIVTLGFAALFFAVGTFVGFVEYVSPIYVSILTIPMMIFGGGLEEIGWRFLLQPELEKKLPFGVSTSITAIVWAIWHFPLFWIEGTSQYHHSFGVFTIQCFGMAFLLAAIYRLSKSVWLCIFFHALTNSLYSSFTWHIENFSENSIPAVILTIVMVAVSYLTVIVTKKIQKQSEL